MPSDKELEEYFAKGGKVTKLPTKEADMTPFKPGQLTAIMYKKDFNYGRSDYGIAKRR
jgi:hypothetical protein